MARFIMCRYTLEHSATHFNSLLQIGERAILIGLCGWVTHHFLSSSFEPLSAQLLAQAKNTGAQILALIRFCFPQLLQVQCRVHQ